MKNFVPCAAIWLELTARRSVEKKKMRLPDFILENIESILREWEGFARSIRPPQRPMDASDLRGHVKEILKEIVAELKFPNQERKRDAEGDTPAGRHADARAANGFSVDQVVSEYRVLRCGILSLWGKPESSGTCEEFDELIRFNEALDRALAGAVTRYDQAVRHAQDIFLGVLGHDLRTPLNSLSLGSQYLMRSEEADARLIQLGSRMFKSTARMAAILDNLLDFTHIRTGIGIPIRVAEVNLALLSEQIAEEFRVSHPGKVIRTHAEGDVTGRWDAGRIGQIYQNLIGNAIQYGAPETPITIQTRANGNEIILSVHNNGAPIPPAVREHIFDPLRRWGTDERPPANHKNLGLGLYIVHEIAVAHQGAIEVSSSQETGTTFTVRLPRSCKLPGEGQDDLRSPERG